MTAVPLTMTRPRKCVAGSRDSDGWGDSEAEPQPRGKAARGSALGAAANLGRRQCLPRGLSGVAVGQPGLGTSSRGRLRSQPAPRSLRPMVSGQSGEPMGPVRTQTLWGGLMERQGETCQPHSHGASEASGIHPRARPAGGRAGLRTGADARAEPGLSCTQGQSQLCRASPFSSSQ